MEWPKDKVLLLIEMFRKHPVLWNPKCLDYKDRNKRNEALAEISKFMGEEKEEVERKIRNMRCHYSRELKKEKEKKLSNGAEVNYKSKWFAFESLCFLKDKTQTRKRKDEENSQDNDDSEDLEESKITIEKAIDSPADVSSKRLKSEEMFDCESYTVMKNIYTQSDTKDEFSLFGEQLAIKMRHLNTHHARVVVQHIINTILCEAQLGKYDFPPPSAKQPYQSLTHALASPVVLACGSQSTSPPREDDDDSS